MNCRRARKAIYRFVDGAADEKMQLDLEQHLAGCPGCERLARSLVRSLDLVHRAPQEKLDENFNWKVRLAIHKERAAMHERAASAGSLFRAWNLRFAASAAAGVTVAIAAGWVAIQLVSPWSDQGVAVDGGRGPSHQQSVQEDRVAQPATPLWREGLGARPAGNTMGSVVSGGVHAPSGKSSRVGAIDDMTSPLDSLIRAETAGMTEEQQRRYLCTHIERIEAYLQGQGPTP
jgi:anti-sigma factor RsiW